MENNDDFNPVEYIYELHCLATIYGWDAVQRVAVVAAYEETNRLQAEEIRAAPQTPPSQPLPPTSQPSPSSFPPRNFNDPSRDPRPKGRERPFVPPLPTTTTSLFMTTAAMKFNGGGGGPNTGNTNGPHPSFIRVASPYIFEQKVQECLRALGSSEAKEDTIRLQGVMWIDNVRKALQLPVRTFNTAVVYYHKFRLVHAESEYMFGDAAAAALFTACKIEDTLKKSREIICAAYNLKVAPGEQLSPDDQVFEIPSKTCLGLERLMLESSGFDFRTQHPQKYVIKLVRQCQFDSNTIGKMAFNMCIDIYRTFAPLKQTAPTLAIACVELAARISGADLVNITDGTMYKQLSTTREEVMETILDLLDLYTHHPKATIVGVEIPVDSFINTRIVLNKEMSTSGYARYTEWIASADNNSAPASALQTNNGVQPSPVSPANGDNNNNASKLPANVPTGPRAPDAMVRFMLHADKARAEKETVAGFFAEDEWEEYEVEIEVPVEQGNNTRGRAEREREGGAGR